MIKTLEAQRQRIQRNGQYKHAFSVILLVLIPVFSILGTQLLRFYGSELTLYVLVATLALVPLLVAFGMIPEKLYVLLILSTALALLFATSLNSTYLRGADIHQEYYFANLVETNHYWNSSLPDDYNAMLSVVVLPPVYSIISGMPLIWTLKVVYPILFTLVPVMLFSIFKKQTGSKIGFFSAFFFMSIFTFFTETVGLARQQIGEIFLVLLMFIVAGTSLATTLRKRTVLLLVFAALLSMTHYALASVFIGLSIVVAALFFLDRYLHFGTGIRQKLQRASAPNVNSSPSEGIGIHRAITPLFVGFLVVFTLSWFIYVCGAVTFNNVVAITNRISHSFLTDFLNPQTAQGLFLLLSARHTALHEATRLFHILMQFFIIIGVAGVAFGVARRTFNSEYFYYAIGGVVLLLAAVAVPFLASSLNTTRLYHISVIFLAPFCVMGVLAFMNVSSAIPLRERKTRLTLSRRTSLKAVSILFSAFLLFNTGFPYAVTNIDKSVMNPNWAIKNGTADDRLVLYNAFTPIEEVASATWFSRLRDVQLKTYADIRGRNNALNAYGMISIDEIETLFNDTGKINSASYVYLRTLNIYDGMMEGRLQPQGNAETISTSIIFPMLYEVADKIYSNGGSDVYYSLFTMALNSTSNR